MKNIKFLMAMLLVMIIAASCATTQRAADDEYINDPRTQQIGNRLYVQDPYRGTVILEKDPFTGRYYDATYGPRLGAGFYGYPYGGGYRVYRNYNHGGSYGRGVTVLPHQTHGRK